MSASLNRSQAQSSAWSPDSTAVHTPLHIQRLKFCPHPTPPQQCSFNNSWVLNSVSDFHRQRRAFGAGAAWEAWGMPVPRRSVEQRAVSQSKAPVLGKTSRETGQLFRARLPRARTAMVRRVCLFLCSRKNHQRLMKSTEETGSEPSSEITPSWKGDQGNQGGLVSDHRNGSGNRKILRRWEWECFSSGWQKLRGHWRQDSISRSYHKPMVMPSLKTRKGGVWGQGEQKNTQRLANGFQRRKMQFTAPSSLSGLNLTISSGNQRFRRPDSQGPLPLALNTTHLEAINSQRITGSTLVIKWHRGTLDQANCSKQVATCVKF